MSTTTAQGRYEALTGKREPYLWRGRSCAKLTIPALLPDTGTTSSTSYTTPWQSIGARGVNNLSAKMLLSLLPVSSPFFRLDMEDDLKDRLEATNGQQGGDFKATLEAGLSRYAARIHAQMERMEIRPSSAEVFKHLLVVGNVLAFYPNQGPARFYRLDKYVVRRNPDGSVSEIIIKEMTNPASLPPRAQALLPHDVKDRLGQGGNHAIEPVAVYTVCEVMGGKWRVWQELNGSPIPGTAGSYPLDACPYQAYRMVRADGEDYGRSYVEEYFGDLKSLEGLEKAILTGAAAAAKVIILVAPNGTTRPEDIANANSGDVKRGNRDDVSSFNLEKFADFRAALDKSRDLHERLSHAFLLNSAIQRSGERVTAEEIRYMARELEDALGGLYSLMAQEFQLPLVRRVTAILRKAGKLPVLPEGSVAPTIVTGLEALGRGHDLGRLDEYLGNLPQVVGERAAQFINVEGYLLRRATALSIDSKGLILTQAEVNAIQAQAAQAQAAQTMLEKGTAPAVSAVAGQMAEGGGAELPDDVEIPQT